MKALVNCVPKYVLKQVFSKAVSAKLSTINSQ